MPGWTPWVVLVLLVYAFVRRRVVGPILLLIAFGVAAQTGLLDRLLNQIKDNLG